MALGGHELLLIVRAQNQASQALRRVALDTAKLGSIRNMHLRQQQLALQNSRLLAQRQGIENRLQDIGAQTQKRAADAALRGNQIAASRARLINRQINADRALQNATLTRDRSINASKARASQLITNQRLGLDRISKAQRQLQNIEQDYGTQNLALRKRAASATAAELTGINQLQIARAKEMRAVQMGLSGENLAFFRRARQAAEQRLAAAQLGVAALPQAQKNAVARAKELRQTIDEQSRSIAKNSAAHVRNAEAAVAAQTRFQNTAGRTRANLAAIEKDISTNAQQQLKSDRDLRNSQANLARRASLARRELSNVNESIRLNVKEQGALSKAISVQRWDRLQTGARIFTHLGRVMQMAGLVGGAALGYLAHTAAQFNTQVTLVATQTGPIGSGFLRIQKNAKFLQTALLDVMKQGTATKEELTAAAYDIYSSLTIPGSNLRQLKTGVGILREFNKAAIAGSVPVQEVGKAVISVLGAFKEIQPTGKNVHKMLQLMFASVRFGRFTFAELTQNLATAAPAARAAGQSFETLMGSLAFLSRPLGINKAAVGFARLSEVLSREKMVSGLKELGVNITDARGHLFQMPEIIDRITRKFPELTKGGVALTQFFKKVSGSEGTIQARRAFVFLAQQLDRYRLVLHQTVTDQNEFDRSFKGMRATAGVQFGVFINNLKAFGIALGEAVLPVLVKLSKPLQDLAHWFENLDNKQKDTIGKYATYAAALLLFGGTVIAVGGMVVSFIATMGKFGIAGFGLAAALLAVVAVVKVLRGDWSSLSDVVNDGVNTMTGSIKGFVAMSALLVVASLRIRKAVLATQVALLGASAGGGLRTGGMLAGITGAAATGRLTAMYKAEAGASRLSAGLAGAAAGAARLPGPLKLAAAVIGIGAGAALLWKLHMSGVEERARAVQRIMDQAALGGQRPITAAQRFGGLGMDVRDLLRTKTALADIRAQESSLQKQIAAAPLGQRVALQRQLTFLQLDEANALDDLRVANAKTNKSFDQFTLSIRGHAETLTHLGQRVASVKRDQKELNRIFDAARIGGIVKVGDHYENAGQRLNFLNSRIKLNTDIIKMNTQKSITQLTVLRRQYFKFVRDLSSAHIIQRPSRVAREALLQASIARGRPLTIPEMRQVIKAVVDRGSLRKMPADIRAAINRGRYIVRLQTAVGKRGKLHLGTEELRGEIGALYRNAGKTRSNVSKVFSKTIHQKVKIDQPKNAFSVGAKLASDLAAGVGSVNISKHISVKADLVIKTFVKQARKSAKTGSPSKLTRDMIGVPLMEGVIEGILSKLPDLEKASSLAIDFFQGPWLTSDAFTNATKKRSKDIESLHKRIDRMRRIGDTTSKTYKRLLKELATAPRARGTKFSDLLKDLRMQNRMLVMFNTSLERLRRRGVPLQLLNQLQELGTQGAKYMAILSRATNKELRQYVRTWRSAQKQIANSMHTNFEQVMGNLHDFVERAAQTLLDKFNEIRDGIKGSFMDISNIADWGAPQHAMSASRIIRNADNMAAQFNEFNTLLDSMISRGLPLDMILQLAQMGPAALPILKGLNSMTSDQFNHFVGIWKETQGKIDSISQKLMKEQVEEWQKHGKDIAIGIITGIMSEQESLLKFFRKLFKNLLKEARKETGSHSPSKVFELLGRDLVGGLALGLASGNNFRVPIPVPSGRAVGGRSNNEPAPIVQNIYAQHNESLMTTLERASFRLRNRRP